VSERPLTPQLPLRLRFPAPRRFDAFVVGDNAATLAAVTRLAHAPNPENLFLCGPEGSGKTHLLSAAVADTAGAIYLPLAQLGDQVEPMIMAASQAPLICVDEVDVVAGRRSLEITLFDLFNRVCDSHGRILFAARNAPARIGIVLPDLTSRLASLVQFSLKPLDDNAAREVLIDRAQQRGFQLEEGVLEFLFRRFPRNLGPMLELIDQLDVESLAQRRRITVPFVRSVVEKTR
jgi:DnaA-homolog protein